MEGDYPEVITKAGNTTEKRIRAGDNSTRWKHTRKTGNQNRKRPAEAAGSFKQVAHDGGNAVNYNATQPFEQREPVPRLLRRHTTAVHSELAGDLLCKKTNRYFFKDRQCRKLRYFLRIWVRYIWYQCKRAIKKNVRWILGTNWHIWIHFRRYKRGLKIPLLHKPEKTFWKITNLLWNINIL
jgi:hypothetical protein